tara:strand:+ start:2889 stop:3872 length:984 start_codon:yes stop_codon:yes gene_type:complete
MRVNASSTLANGLRTEFWDTYASVSNRVADSRLASVMNLNVGATNREHDFAYFESAPHFDLWKRGDEIKSKAMDSVAFNVPVYEWGRRVPWLKWDKDDDQTQSLMDVARQAGQSAALLPERFFFDLIQNNTGLLPSIPTAPDGAAMFATTAGGSARFGATNGNLLTGGGVTAAAILTDFYDCIVQFLKFQDTQGQPLLGDQVFNQPFVIIHPVELTEAMETAFLQKQQQGGSNGGSNSNLVADTAKNVTLWPSARLTDANDWYCFLGEPPKEQTFFLDRQGVQEETALLEDNNSDHARATAEESIQWFSRSGAGIALPYGAIKTTNS